MADRVPSVTLDGGRLEALELISSGLLAGVDGYGLPGERTESSWFTPTLDIDRSLLGPVREVGRLELRDTESTPVALLELTAHRESGDRIWVAGTVRRIRPFEHGPSRSMRFDPADDVGQRTAVIIDRGTGAAALLRLAMSAKPLVLVAVGSESRSESAHLVAEAVECADVLPDAVVRFIPAVDLGAGEQTDVPRAVIESMGVLDSVDLRRETALSPRGAVLLFTGLSGAGKSTIARAVADEINGRGSAKAVLLDGDHVRAELSSELSFSAEDRDRNLRRQAWVGARVAEAGGLAICAPIAPFEASRAAMRAKVEPESDFIVIHVSTPLAVAEERDRKGLYAKARAGQIKDFTGIDSPYEVPQDADLRLDTSVLSVAECVEAVMDTLQQKGLVSGH